MRVVFLGKGGSGKSTLAGLLCAELAGRNERVTAIDADTVPGLDQVLGMESIDDWSLAGAAVRDHGGWKLDGSPAEIVDRCSREAPGGVRFLQMGNVDSRLKEHEMRREQHLDRWSGTVAFNTVSRVFDEAGGWTIVDLQGGTLQVAGGMGIAGGILGMLLFFAACFGFEAAFMFSPMVAIRDDPAGRGRGCCGGCHPRHRTLHRRDPASQ